MAVLLRGKMKCAIALSAVLLVCVGCDGKDKSQLSADQAEQPLEPEQPSIVLVHGQAPGANEIDEQQLKDLLTLLDAMAQSKSLARFDQVYRPLILARAGQYQQAVDAIPPLSEAYPVQLRALAHARVATIAIQQGRDELAAEILAIIDEKVRELIKEQNDSYEAREMICSLIAAHEHLGHTEQAEALLSSLKPGRALEAALVRERMKVRDFHALMQMASGERANRRGLHDAIFRQVSYIERTEGVDAAAERVAGWLAPQDDGRPRSSRIDALVWLAKRGLSDQAGEAWPQHEPHSLDHLNANRLAMFAAGYLLADSEAGPGKAADLLSALDLAHTAPAIFAQAGRHDAFRQAFAEFFAAEQARGELDPHASIQAAFNLHRAGFTELALELLRAIPAPFEQQRRPVWEAMAEFGAVDEALASAERGLEKMRGAPDPNANWRSVSRMRALIGSIRFKRAEQLWRDGKHEEASALFDRCLVECCTPNPNEFNERSLRESDSMLADLMIRRVEAGDVEGAFAFFHNPDYEKYLDVRSYLIKERLARGLIAIGESARAKKLRPTNTNENPWDVRHVVLGLIDSGRVGEAIDQMFATDFRRGREQDVRYNQSQDMGAWRRFQAVVHPEVGRAFIEQGGPALPIHDLQRLLGRTQGCGLYAIVHAMDDSNRTDDADALINLFAETLDASKHPPLVVAQLIDLMRQRGRSDEAIDIGLAYIKSADSIRIRSNDEPVESEESAQARRQWLEAVQRFYPPWNEEWRHVIHQIALASTDSGRFDVDLGLDSRARQIAMSDWYRAVESRPIAAAWPTYRPITDAIRQRAKELGYTGEGSSPFIQSLSNARSQRGGGD